MRVSSIQQINEAVFVLKHFIDLSARLLPILYNLDQRENPTAKDLKDKDKIIQVFDQHHFDAETSKVLIESDILERIQNCYFKIVHSASASMKKDSLVSFLKEYNRLKNNWQIVESN